MEPLTLLMIFLAGLVGAFFGTTIGGGALITVPMLIFAGLATKQALATHLLGALGLTIGGFIRFYHAKKIDFALGWKIFFITAAGTVTGANILLDLPVALVDGFVGIIILALGIFIFAKKDIGVVRRKFSEKSYLGYICFFFVGLWGGIFAGGTGTFMLYVLLFFFGKTFLEAAGTMKLGSWGIAVPGLAVFWLHGLVVVEAGLAQMGGMFIGSFVGSHYALKKGDAWVRGLFLLVVVVMALKLFFG